MKKHDFWVATIMIICGAAAIIAVQQYPSESRMMPMIYSVALILLSGLLFRRSLKREEKTERREEPLASYGKFFMVAAAILAYIFLISFLGFYSSTLIFMFLFMTMLRATNIFTVIIISLVTTGLIYVFFDLMLHIPIPGGLLF